MAAIYHPAADGKGKWHARKTVTDVAACGAGALLDISSGARIQAAPGEKVHPIVCRRCVKAAG